MINHLRLNISCMHACRMPLNFCISLKTASFILVAKRMNRNKVTVWLVDNLFICNSQTFIKLTFWKVILLISILLCSMMRSNNKRTGVSLIVLNGFALSQLDNDTSITVVSFGLKTHWKNKASCPNSFGLGQLIVEIGHWVRSLFCV